MQETGKKRKLKKPVKIGIFAVLAVLIFGGLFLTGKINPAKINGYLTLDKELPQKDPDIIEYILEAQAEYKKLGDGRWTILQRYEVGKNSACVTDCANVCTDGDLDYEKAYSQSWGLCKCNCRLPGTADVSE